MSRRVSTIRPDKTGWHRAGTLRVCENLRLKEFGHAFIFMHHGQYLMHHNYNHHGHDCNAPSNCIRNTGTVWSEPEQRMAE